MSTQSPVKCIIAAEHIEQILKYTQGVHGLLSEYGFQFIERERGEVHIHTYFALNQLRIEVKVRCRAGGSFFQQTILSSNGELQDSVEEYDLTLADDIPLIRKMLFRIGLVP